MKSLDTVAVCKNASVRFDEKTYCYILRSFCADFSINTDERIIRSLTPSGEVLINKYGYFFIYSCLWYLINAKDISLTGRLIKPEDLKGGDLFFRGSHILPLDRMAEKFQDDKQVFLKRGREICGETLLYGDASIKLSPLPRIPVILILWVKDEEFPARADLLLDSSCEVQLPLDIIWSTAMLSVLVML
ncbi:MAG: DUF3786 domain-containing protein [Nitrospirae bacterium]|nr:DUF3786 domain-containing protein [Nitrospirota bacterium]